MLVVKIELWPGGHSGFATEIGEIRIANVSNLTDISNYVAELDEYGNERLGIKPSNKKVTIEGHDRRQSVFSLIRKVLNANY